MEIKKCEKCGCSIAGHDNFCPQCGDALTATGENIKNEEYKRVKLKMLLELSNEMKDSHSLIVLKEYLSKL